MKTLITACASGCLLLAAGATCWPRSHELRLVSPDGRHSVIISATNDGATVTVGGSDHFASAVTIAAGTSTGATVHVAAKGGGANVASVILTEDNLLAPVKGRTLGIK